MSELIPERPIWLRRYLEEYLTLDEVGALEGITKEAVRQRLEALGIKPRTAVETNQLRERRETSLRAEAIRQAFLRTRNLEETANRVGLQVTWVKRFVEEHVPDFEVLTKAPRSDTKKYSSEDLFASLREAASSAPSNLTAAAYETFVQTHRTLADGRARPGVQTMSLRYGSWRGALDAAGLPANPPAGPKPRSTDGLGGGVLIGC